MASVIFLGTNGSLQERGSGNTSLLLFSSDYKTLVDVSSNIQEAVKVDIDTQPSRTAYGFLNNTDFAKKYGDLGKQNIQSHTSELTQSAWDMAKNGARPGASKIAAQAKSKFWGEVVQWPGWEAKHVPDPVFTVTPSRVEGQMNPGSDSYDINTTGHADIAIKTGSAETYIAQKGDIRMWTTKGHYDIYA